MQRQAEQEQDQRREARQAAAHSPPLEAGDSRRQHIGDREAGRERHQDALHQAEDDDDEQQKAEPEQQPVGARRSRRLFRAGRGCGAQRTR